MAVRIPFQILLLFSLAMVGMALSPSSYLTTIDKERLRSVFKSSLGQDDLPSVAYSVLGFKLLGDTIPDTANVCKKLQKGVEAQDASLAAIYQASVAAKALGGCSLTLSSAASQAVTAAMASDASVSNLYYAVFATLDTGKKVDSAAVLKTLQAALKKDDTLQSLGFAFQIGSALDGDVSSIFDRIEDAVVQADEVDGKVLQFEGGLSVTSQIISGAYKMAAKAKKAPAISKAQAVKFAEYFMTRKSVHQAKGAFQLLDVLTVLTTNAFHVPVAITIEGGATVSSAHPKVQVRVSNLLGNSLGKMDVVIESAMRQSDGAVILSNSKMTALPTEGLYEVDLFAAKPGRGFYELTVTATPTAGANKDALVGNTGTVLLVKSLAAVSVEGVELGVADSDQATASKLNAVKFQEKFSKVLEADHHQKVILKFSVVDAASKEKLKVHQAFVRLANEKSEIIFVAEPDSNNFYKFDLDVNAKSKEFGGKSGKYGVHLIIGDAVISNSVAWHLADINLKFSGEDDASQATPVPENVAKPEIRHKFREPEVRPPPVVSNAFTLLCLAPILLMFIGWLKIGVNVANMPFSLSSIGFHAGLAAIFGLYYCFWLQLDMFATLKYLIMIGVVTFLCGNSLLTRIADKRKAANQQ